MSTPRDRMPPDRTGKTRRFSVRYVDELTGDKRELKFYASANVYPDGRLGELFVRGDKIGGLLGGALDTVAIMFSLGLQHGIPMSVLTAKLRHQKFGPGGFTGDAEFPSCSSMFDLIAQWLEREFPDGMHVANGTGNGAAARAV